VVFNSLTLQEMKHKIAVEGIRLYAYHGCLEEESKIGQEYQVDIYIDTDFSGAVNSDELNLTVDYCQVYDIVKQEMQIRSKLIERVASRIQVHLLKEIPSIQSVRVRVTKFNPPMNGNVERVYVEV
jgi:7,8-dihydroneopterin aldolase/epimerase/oxygenase